MSTIKLAVMATACLCGMYAYTDDAHALGRAAMFPPDIALSGPGSGSTNYTQLAAGDALVPGTKYHAVGKIDCSFKDNPQVKTCRFGVVRHGGGNATVDVTFPDGFVRTLEFRDGAVTATDGNETISEMQGDNTTVRVGGTETFIIPIIVNEGG